MDHHGQQQPQGAHHDVAFAAGYPFASVVTSGPPFFCGLHRLSVNDGRAGSSFPTSSLPNPRPQGFFNAFPGAVIPPVAKVPPHSSPRRQVVRHHPPGYAATQHVQNAVHCLTYVGDPGMAFGGVRRRQGRQFLPLRIGQITGIKFPTHSPSVTSIPFLCQQQPPSVQLIITHPLRRLSRITM